MKLTVASTATLIGLMLTVITTCHANEQVTYTYQENSNNAYTESYWQEDPCIDINYFSMFLSDGFVQSSSGNQLQMPVTSVSGSATYYTKCKSTGATRTDVSFYSTDPVHGLSFTPLTDVSIRTTNMTAFYSKSLCVIQSYDYPDFEAGEETYSYYVCGDVFDSGTKRLSIDTKMTLPSDDSVSSEYTSINKGVNRGPGYITKYESESRCQTAVTTKNIIKLGKKIAFVIPDNNIEFSTHGEICKVQSGSTERYMFTDN